MKSLLMKSLLMKYCLKSINNIVYFQILKLNYDTYFDTCNSILYTTNNTTNFIFFGRIIKQNCNIPEILFSNDFFCKTEVKQYLNVIISNKPKLFTKIMKDNIEASILVSCVEDLLKDWEKQNSTRILQMPFVHKPFPDISQYIKPQIV